MWLLFGPNDVAQEKTELCSSGVLFVDSKSFFCSLQASNERSFLNTQD